MLTRRYHTSSRDLASDPSLLFSGNFKPFAEQVEKMSGGRLKIETLPPGAVVGAFEVADGVNRGVLDMAHTCTYYFIGKHKAAALFPNHRPVPWLVQEANQEPRRHEGDGVPRPRARRSSNIFGAVFARLGSATLMTETLLALPFPPVVMLLIMMPLVFLLGWPFEWPVIVLVFVPIPFPLVEAMKFDLVWFCTLVAVNLQTAYLSPPVAMSAYYLKSVVPSWELKGIYAGMMQFMVLQLLGLLALIAFPQIALWLPNKLFGP